jgi:hypothetical protein
MSGSGPRFIRLLIALLAAAAFALTPVGAVLASHVHPQAEIPADMVVGKMSRIPVTLEDAQGAPLPATTVVFYVHALFAGVEGEAEIGRALTDEKGSAALAYRPRQAGHHQLRIEYRTPADGEVEVFSTVFDVSGGEQLYRSPATVDIPGAGGGLVMAVLTTVWLILFSVALRIVAIARAGRPGGTPRSERAR